MLSRFSSSFSCSFLRSSSRQFLRPISSHRSNWNQYEKRFSFGPWGFTALGVAGAVSCFIWLWDQQSETNPSLSEKEPYVYKIVLTGGPCGGKSTALSKLSERLESLGYDVYLVPEVATILITGGTSFLGRTREEYIALNGVLMGIQEKLEDSFEQIARLRNKDSVILCDRGMCDNRAYIPKEDFEKTIDLKGWTIPDIRDRRYHAVFHLVTAAIGAEKFYTTANNAARSESPAQAREVDYRILDAWLGHPNLRVIDNSTSFEGKIKRVVDGICKSIGAIPSFPERKFLVRNIDLPSDLSIEEFEVQTAILTDKEGQQIRAIRRTQEENSSYYLTTSVNDSDGKRIIQSRLISPREYSTLVSSANVSKINKKINYFIWNGRYYALNDYLGNNIVTLEVESDPNATDVIPPFIQIDREVTANAYYSTEGLAGLVNHH